MGNLRKTMTAVNSALDHPGTAALLDDLISLDPEWAEAWNRRATWRYLTGDYGGSLSDIKKTLALEPRHFGAISGRGLVLAKLGKHTEGIASQAEAQRVRR